MRTFTWAQLAAIVLLSACSNQRTVATLPDHEVSGYESSAFSLYKATQSTGTTAMGQVFSPPSKHSYLTEVGFALRYPPYEGARRGEILLRLRISAWGDDRPASVNEWESEAIRAEGKEMVEWIRFKVPHLRLIPGKKYIAWLSLDDPNNPSNASISVVSMGPFTVVSAADTRQIRPEGGPQPNSWTFDYQEGLRAFWRSPNPSGTIDGMTESAWEVDPPGKCLRFEMKFENIS